MLMICLGVALCIFACYFMGAGFIVSALGARQEIILPMYFICAASYALGSLLSKLPKAVRLTAVVPVLLCALLCRSIPEYALIPIPAAIIIAVQLTGKYTSGYHEFKSAYIKMLAACVVLMLLLWLFLYMGNLGAYLTVFCAVSGILTLRMLRQDAQVYSSKRFILFNTLPMALFIAVMLVLGSGSLLDSVLHGIGWVIKMIGRGVLLLVGGLGYLLILLFGKEETLDDMSQAEATESPEPTAGIKLILRKFHIGESRDNTDLMIILGVLLILIIGTLTVLLILRRSRAAQASGRGASLEKRSKYNGGLGRTASSSAHAQIPRANGGIRSIYRKWLKLLRKKRVELHRSDTSLDVMEKRVPPVYPFEPQNALREVYIKVRYDDSYSATGEDQRRAKQAFAELSETEFDGLTDTKWS